MNREVGRVELRERGGPLRVDPPHARTELANGVNRELHEGERSLEFVLGIAGNVDGHESSRNLLDRRDGKATKVSSTNLREQALHEKSHSVEVGNDDEGVGGTVVVLEVADGHPKEPCPQWLETLELLGDGERRADLTRTPKEANEVLDLSRILLVMLEMNFHLLNLFKGALESIEVFGPGLAGAVILARRGWGRRERAALGDEVSELRLMLPRIHGINDLDAVRVCFLFGIGGYVQMRFPASAGSSCAFRRRQHFEEGCQRCTSLPVSGLPGEDKGCRKDGIGGLSRKGANRLLQAIESNTTVLVGHATDQGAVSKESNVHSRESEQSVHDVRRCGSDPEKTVGPMSAVYLGYQMGQCWTNVGMWRVHSVKLLASMDANWQYRVAT